MDAQIKGQNMIRKKIFAQSQVPPYKIFINFKDKDNNFIVEKLGSHQSN